MRRIPLPLVSLVMIAALMVGAYAPGYLWRVNWRINPLTSFEICETKLTGETHADQIPLRCFHVTAPTLPSGVDQNLFSESALPIRIPWPLAPAITDPETGEVLAPGMLTVPMQMREAAAQNHGQVVTLSLADATDAERKTLGEWEAMDMPGVLLALVTPTPVQPRYHEFINADERLLVFFKVPLADRVAAAASFEELMYDVHIYDCASGAFLSTLFIPVVNFPQIVGSGEASILLEPGLYCVIKTIWYTTTPVTEPVAGTSRIIITATPA